MNQTCPSPTKLFRGKAIRRIKRKRDFQGHVIVFLIVNTGLWLTWATINRADTDHLWRAWVTGIWLIVLMFVAFKMYGERPISDQRISEEVRRMQGR